MKILFARVGYMKFYNGPQIGDEKPIGGGKHNKNEVGGEIYNFTEINGNIYGYFQPHMKKPYDINIQRIEKNCSDDLIKNVLVIWFASNPISKGQIIVGWYKNATVYRHIQEDESFSQRGYKHFNVKVEAKNAFLLPISSRKFSIGHQIKKVKLGNLGTSNVFYTLDKDGDTKQFTKPYNKWILKAINYVQKYTGTKLSGFNSEAQENIVTSISGFGNQGFQSDIKIRLMIEAYAMKICENHYKELGFKVKDVSANHSYDLLIEKSEISFFVEVKGTQTEANNIILTKNEVALSKNEGANMILFIVHSIKMNKRSVKKDSGILRIVEPWIVNQKS